MNAIKKEIGISYLEIIIFITVIAIISGGILSISTIINNNGNKTLSIYDQHNLRDLALNRMLLIIQKKRDLGIKEFYDPCSSELLKLNILCHIPKNYTISSSIKKNLTYPDEYAVVYVSVVFNKSTKFVLVSKLYGYEK